MSRPAESRPLNRKVAACAIGLLLISALIFPRFFLTAGLLMAVAAIVAVIRPPAGVRRRQIVVAGFGSIAVAFVAAIGLSGQPRNSNRLADARDQTNRVARAAVAGEPTVTPDETAAGGHKAGPESRAESAPDITASNAPQQSGEVGSNGISEEEMAKAREGTKRREERQRAMRAAKAAAFPAASDSAIDEPSPADRKRLGSPATATTAAKDAVLAKLRTPSTAEFPWFSAKARYRGNGEWLVAGVVDAQNSFGAMIRNNWTVIIKCEGNGVWTPSLVEVYEP